VDIENHSAYQRMFEAENKPFVGFIIGPYCQSIDESCLSLLRCFHTNDRNAFNLEVNLLPSTRIDAHLMGELRKVLEGTERDKVNLRLEKWQREMKKGDKLIRCLRTIFELNRKLLEDFCIDMLLEDLHPDETVKHGF